MPMTLSEYDELIKKLEALEAENPRGYKLRVAGLAAAGFGYILFAFTLVLFAWFVGIWLSVMGGLIWLTLVCGAGFCFTLYSSARTLFVSIPRPQGRVLSRSEAPVIFEELEALRDNLGAPKIHEVILSEDYNAAMIQTPRLGVFGLYHNTMVLGLPLLMSLSREEFRSVIGHELGHAAGQHSRFASWIYRLRKTWEKLQQAIIAQEHPTFLFKRFFESFVPYFNAYTFVLARANEYVADSAAAQVTSPEVAGRALLRVHLDNAWLEAHFWKEIDELNKTSPIPPKDLYPSMRDALSETRDEKEAELELQKALEQRTDLVDTHPSLSRRLGALNYDPTLPTPVEEPAAISCLGARYEDFLREFSTSWHANVQMYWNALYVRNYGQRERLEELEERLGELEKDSEDAESKPLSADEFLEYATLVEAQRGKEEAMDLYREHLELHGDSAGARFAIGRLLLGEKDEEGITWLEEAMATDEIYTGHVTQLMLEYEYNVRDDKERAQFWLEKHDAWQLKLAQSQRERSFIAPADRFLAHSLEEEMLAKILDVLARFPEIKRAYLVEKKLEHFPDKRLFILGILPKRLKAPTHNKQQQLVQSIAEKLTFDVDILLFNLADSNLSWLKKKAAKTPGSLLEVAP